MQDTTANTVHDQPSACSAELSLPAPAKLNLMLHIVGRRADGYHLLETVFQFLDYADTLHFSARTDGKIILHTTIDGVAHEDNLIVRAARLLQARSKGTLGADIWLDKKLPIGGGIGGGKRRIRGAMTLHSIVNQKAAAQRIEIAVQKCLPSTCARPILTAQSRSSSARYRWAMRR